MQLYLGLAALLPVTVRRGGRSDVVVVPASPQLDGTARAAVGQCSMGQERRRA